MEPSGDYYQQFLTSISGVGPDISSTPSPQDAHPPQFGHQSAPMPLGRPPVPSPYHHFGYFSGFPDGMVFNTSGSQRVRRKSAPGFEHIKHRRTRSGCYTCRSRRVKCDEGRPICARCKKGKRDCVYPEPTAPKQSAAASRKGQSSQQDQSPDSSHDDEEGDTEQESKLDTILDEEEQDSDAPTHPSLASVSAIRRSSTPSASGLQRLTVRARRDSETPSAEGNKSSSPATSTGTSSSLPPINLALPPLANFTDALRDDWTRLPQDVRFYLSYFHENVTYYHYAMVSDSDDFFRTILPSIAIHSDSLLYALVAFSAYHYALNDPNGSMSHFLQFYNQSVRLLLKALKKRDSHDIATLLTILQLATIEEYLGDWVNVMGHQKAAFELLTRMFVPESVMQSPPGRMSLSWYSRFDVFVGLMGSFETILPERWFLISLEYYQSQTAHDPQSVGLKFEEYSARLRLISMRMANIYGRRAKGLISDDVYATQHKRLNSELQEWRASWDPAIASPELLVKDFPNRTPLSAGDIVDPFAPGVLYAHPAFPLTVLGCEWHSIMMMHQCQSSSELSEQHMTEMTRRAYAICQAFATIEQWPYTPQGALTMIQSCIGIATLFLPQDERHHMWIRRRYARIESLGYIIPATTRKRMAELFRDQSCVRWWLPDDDGFTPLLKNLRSFADERNATVVSAQKGNLREIRHVFSRMRLRGTDELHQTPESEHGSLAGSVKGKGKALD